MTIKEMKDKIMDEKEKWHLDKRVPIAMIAAIIGQAIVFVWMGSSYATRTDMRLESLERGVPVTALSTERLTRIEESQKWMAQVIVEIKNDVKSIARK